MKKVRIISLFLALAIGGSLTGCKNDPSQALAEGSTPDISEQTGYTEIEITPPQGITGRPVDFWAAEGGGLLYASYDGENVLVYESLDQGESWETTRTIAVEDARRPPAESAGPIFSGVYSQGLLMLTPEGDVLDWADRAGEPENILLKRYKKDGSRTETVVSKADVFDIQPAYIESAKALSESQILLSYSLPAKSGAIGYGVFDLETNELFAMPGEYFTGSEASAYRLSTCAGTAQGVLYLAHAQNSILKNELGTDEAAGVPLGDAPNGEIKAFTAAGDALYALTDKNEVWKINTAGSWEKLLEGQYGYALPEYTGILLRADAEGRLYMAAYGNGTTHIYRYGREARQTKEHLYILSLGYSETVAAAAARFRIEHPETEVRYEALEETYEGQPRSDMLHALNAAIASGAGPDVLILDGLPVSRYLAQGILTPLDDLINSGDIYASLLEPLRAEGEIYFVPAKFSMPLLFGTGQELEGLSSPQALLKKIKAYSANNPYVAASATKTPPVSPDQCEPVAMQICMFDAGDWELADGYGWGNGAAFELWY
ncbi:MAG: extracellular solute-binding protein, partial [Oscillospiraceae bacterium]|nr:extracellular solute-binding protein [Oscillospiraceae bacterium]